MARRTRTARSLAQRIDLEYFKRRHPFRRWLLLLSIGAPALVVAWLAAATAAGSRASYSSGPLAPPHAAFADRCERCHVVRAGRVMSRLEDSACLACHDAPAHKPNQTFTPSCASCHVEHRGRVPLAAVADRACTQCHGSLQTTDGQREVARSVGPLPGAHPEFAALRPGVRDRTKLRFNHQVHLKPNLGGPNGPTTLQCATCHSTTDAARRVRRGETAAGGQDVGRAGLMSRITFVRNCASCHPLYFDPLIATQVPHDTPEVVHRAVVDALRAYVTAHPDQIGRPDPVRRIPLNFAAPAPVHARTPEEWVRMRSAAAERLLWAKTCAECHEFTRAAGDAALPREVPTNVPATWIPHARFDHRAHQLATCASCHASAGTSRETSDVLIPSIATCRRCHTGDAGAESRCFECHQYHDWSKATSIPNGAYDLRALTR